MTYRADALNYDVDPNGRPWAEGDLRVFHDDDRQYWSVTRKGHAMYGTSWLAWYDHGGEIFHEGAWIKLKGGLEHVEAEG